MATLQANRELRDLIPGEWLRRYLALPARQTGMHVRLLDPSGATVLAEAPPDGQGSAWGIMIFKRRA